MADQAETTITLTDAPDDDERAVIMDGLRAYNEAQAGLCAIVLPPAPSWSRRYVPAYTTFLLKKHHPCLYHLLSGQAIARFGIPKAKPAEGRGDKEDQVKKA